MFDCWDKAIIWELVKDGRAGEKVLSKGLHSQIHQSGEGHLASRVHLTLVVWMDKTLILLFSQTIKYKEKTLTSNRKVEEREGKKKKIV